MPVQETRVSIEELRSLNLVEIAESCKSQVCYELKSAFIQIQDSNAAKLLSASCSMHLKPENIKAPFSPKFLMQDHRGVVANDFSKESLTILAEFCSEVEIPEIKARLADICWVTKSGTVEHAYIAIQAYLESAQLLLSEGDTWIHPAERIERALRLSCVFRRETQRPDLFDSVSSFVISEIDSKKIDEPPFYSLKLLNLAHECGVGEQDWILATAEEIARTRYELNDTRTAISAWECALNSAIAARDKNKQQEIWRHIANCHVKDSESQDGGLIASGALLKAIDSLSKVPNTRQERLELYEKMRDFQLESLHQMHEFSSPAQDISEIVHQAKKQVQGKNFFDMLFRLAVLVSRPTNIEQLKVQAKEQMQTSFVWMFGGTHIDHDGMTVATVPAGMGLENDQDGENVWSIMMRNIGIDHQLAVQGQIRPALDEITILHPISERVIESFFSNHPFIPYGHEYYFTKGLALGLEGDFLTACHILIPQVENSLRYILRSQGEEPTTLHGDGSQERNGLRSLLENQAVLEVLGKDIVGNLQAILIDKIYGDLRNQMSHGYVPAGHFFGVAPIFFWWLILHILMLPFSQHWKKNYQPDDTANTQSQSDT